MEVMTAENQVSAAISSGGDTWLDQRHPEFRASIERWNYAWDHYTGDVLDSHKRSNYLIRKAQAESEAAYLERSALADYTPHFSTVADALAGMLFAVEGDAIRFWGSDEKPGLGDPSDEQSPTRRLFRDADGQGTGWLTFFKQLAIELVVMHRSWILVTNKNGKAYVRKWPSTSVVNWWYNESGALAEVLVMERTDMRTGLRFEGKGSAQKAEEVRYVLYTATGWERWKKSDDGNPMMVGSGSFGSPFKDEEGQPILPIYPVVLPMRRHVGWLLAKKANAIFNKESERDHLLRTANFPLLILVGNDTQFKKHAQNLKEGVRALQQDPSYSSTHAFIAPSSESAVAASDVLKRKVEEFYVNAFKEYGDAAREKTATETRQDVASGVGAFLQMLKAAVDDAENEAAKRVAQVEYPGDQRRWFVNRVERSDTFVPTDVEGVIQKMKDRYFHKDQPMPLGPTGLLSVAKQIADYDGLEIDEEELRAAIMTGEVQRLSDLMTSLPVPAEVRVEMTIELLVALGRLDPKDAVKLEDGSEINLVELMRQKMTELAQADDEARKRMAQPLDMGPGGPPRKEDSFPEDDEE